MKLPEHAIHTLHQLALAEYDDSPAMVRRINRWYCEHVAYLVRAIRRAARRRVRP